MRNAPTADSDRIIVGKHHVRAPAPAGPAFIQQLLDRLHRLTWQTPHSWSAAARALSPKAADRAR